MRTNKSESLIVKVYLLITESQTSTASGENNKNLTIKENSGDFRRLRVTSGTESLF